MSRYKKLFHGVLANFAFLSLLGSCYSPVQAGHHHEPDPTSVYMYPHYQRPWRENLPDPLTGTWPAYHQRLQCGENSSVEQFGPYESPTSPHSNIITYGRVAPNEAAGFQYRVPGLNAQSGEFLQWAAAFDASAGVPLNRMFVHLISDNGAQRLYSFDQLNPHRYNSAGGTPEKMYMRTRGSRAHFVNDRNWQVVSVDRALFAANRIRFMNIFAVNDTNEPVRFAFGNIYIRHRRNNDPAIIYLEPGKLGCGTLQMRPPFFNP